MLLDARSKSASIVRAHCSRAGDVVVVGAVADVAQSDGAREGPEAGHVPGTHAHLRAAQVGVAHQPRVQQVRGL